MAFVTPVGVRPTDHVVLYALRNIPGGCVQAGCEFFQVKHRRPRLDAEPGRRAAVSGPPGPASRRHRRRLGLHPSAGRGGGGYPSGAGFAGPEPDDGAQVMTCSVRRPADRPGPKRPRRRRPDSSWPLARGCARSCSRDRPSIPAGRRGPAGSDGPRIPRGSSPRMTRSAGRRPTPQDSARGSTGMRPLAHRADVVAPGPRHGPIRSGGRETRGSKHAGNARHPGGY
jgi:translation initiation factor IF-2